MRESALSHDILLSVEKPERYIGGEFNSVMKSKTEAAQIRFCLAFPDIYEIGMSNLGLQILYSMFNSWEDVWCERVFSPWFDLDRILRDKNIPLFALESQEPVKNFDFLGISLSYEMAYTNILQLLELSQIPLRAADRTWDHPLVIGGGICSCNPEPIAPFFDLFYIGEGEISYLRLLDEYKDAKKEGLSREEFLFKAAQIPGIYVPSFYEASYNDDGTLASFAPVREGVPVMVEKVLVKDFADSFYPVKPVIPFAKATQDRIVLEIQRGCIRGCRFCQAGYIYRPLREKPLDRVRSLADELIKNTGYEEISLSSLSSSDYDLLPDLLSHLMDVCPDKGINISLPSLRIDAFSLDVMNKVQDIKKSSLTFAPEAGTQRMRDIINKGLTEDEILSGANEAFKGGWNKVKLYFMLGLPFETTEDIKGISALAEQIAKAYYEIPKDQRNGKCEITVSTSFFVPKPFTPFQWASMNDAETFLSKAYFLKSDIKAQLNQKSIRSKYHEADVSVLEGVFARGDRRLAEVIEAAYRNGAVFDAWGEGYRKEYWDKAFADCGIDPGFYVFRERNTDELLPWDFIHLGISRQFLAREWEKAKEGIVTPNCRESCAGCGARKYGCGVCYENQD